MSESSALLGNFCTSLKTLSNPHRLRIMLSLLTGEASVGDLELGLKIKQPNLSHELKKLRDTGMVKTRRESKVIFYSIADQKTESLIGDISTLFLNNENPDRKFRTTPVRSKAENFSRGESHGECGRFPLVQQY